MGLEEPLGELEDKVDQSYTLSGVGPSPKLRRGLHYPKDSIPESAALESTLTTPPFRRPPLSVSQDPDSFLTITSHPHLFKVSSPLDVDEVEKFLAIHPNRPLVDSVIVGLRLGFWPSHDGNFADLRSNSLAFQSEEDLAFIANEMSEDWEAGRLSDPFFELLPGMHVSPTFVIRSDVRKSRSVCDQSITGLNDGILPEEAKTVYDMIPQLGSLLRHYRLNGLDSDYHILWKSDVKGAFRNIPVCPEWMIKQVHRARRTVDGLHSWIYYVDQRLILGNRMSPLIWCTVINLILWCAKVHENIEHIFIFVNDAFSFTISGEFVVISNRWSNEERSVPRDQGKVLLVWNFLGVPWVWGKQLSSSTKLDIIGLEVDGRELTVTLSDNSKKNFDTVATEFLSSTSGNRFASAKPLVNWQRLLGHANWALNVLPFAKFALRSSYVKTRGKTMRLLKIPLNNDVVRDITWLREEITSAPPLFLLDPALDEWGPLDADIIVHCDACLSADPPLKIRNDARLLRTYQHSSGLGFTSKRDGIRSSFYHRSPTVLSSIIWAEALAVFSAICWAVESQPDSRIWIYSDNAAVVYAFDSGRTSDELFPVVRASYEVLSRSRCDLRVRHIPGVNNFFADLISRRDPPTFPFHLNDFGSSVHEFFPPIFNLLRPLPARPTQWIGRRLQ